ncbi:hypothetical protein Tco_0853310 [Tanacetum coccineum]
MELHDVSYGIEYVARPLLLFFSSENRLLWFRYREYDLAHLKLVFEFSIYKVWKSVGYGARIRRIFLDGYGVLVFRTVGTGSKKDGLYLLNLVQSYFFDIQLTNLSPRNCIPLEVLLRVLRHPSWSASEKAVSLKPESFRYHSPMLMVPLKYQKILLTSLRCFSVSLA